MSTARTQALQPSAAVDTARFDAISLTLCNITEIVKLAAFAAETRRTLEGIRNALHYREEMQEVIRGSVTNSSNWTEMEDPSGNVLDYVAVQLEQINDDLNKNFENLAPARPVISDAEKNGGGT